MRVVVFGATGGTGREIVDQALGHGHDVIAFVHNTEMSDDSPRLTLARGDVLDFDAVSAAVAGADGVASALGKSGNAPEDIHERGIANIIHAMAVHDVRKLVAVSASGAGRRNDKNMSIAMRLMATTVLKSVYDDLEAMERRIQASDLVWTILRPVGLTDGPMTGRYRFTIDGSMMAKTSTISRADVAAAALKALETDLWDRRVVTIAD